MKDFEDFREDFIVNTNYNLDPDKIDDRHKLLNRCKERCLYLITDSEKSEKRLREILTRSGKYDDDIIDETMDFLKHYDYLDDRRYAMRLISSYRGKKSYREIEKKLYERGISSVDIREALSTYREDEDNQSFELDAVKTLIYKKCKDPSLLDEKGKQKLYAYLLRKGFSYSMIREALKIDEEF